MSAPENGNDLFRERQSFKRACIFAALALLIYAAGAIFTRVNAGKIAGMIASGDFSPQVIQGQKLQAMAVMDCLAMGIAICAIACGVYFAKWLLALFDRRRRGGGGLPPVARP